LKYSGFTKAQPIVDAKRGCSEFGSFRQPRLMTQRAAPMIGWAFTKPRCTCSYSVTVSWSSRV